MARLAILASHPIQYHAPLFRELARRLDLQVFYAHRATPQDQARAGFGTEFDWDVDLLSGYAHRFLANKARVSGTDHFLGCDTPEIYEALRDGKFDTLLVLGWHLKSFLQGVFAAKRLGMPVMVRGDSQLTTPRSAAKILAKQILYPAALRLFDAALYVGQRSRAYYAHYRFPAERLFFSPHCVDTDWFSTRATAAARDGLRARHGIAEETRLLLFAGKLVPFKRPLDLVAAAALLRRQDASIALLVAGDGALSSSLQQEAAALEVPLHKTGFCNQSEMPAIYAAADMLVLPSDARETWGLVVNEALACGRPVVVSDACGCAPDLAADKITGRTFPLGDSAAMAVAIYDILAKPPGRERIAEKSARYSLGAAADGIVEHWNFAASVMAGVIRRRHNSAMTIALSPKIDQAPRIDRGSALPPMILPFALIVFVAFGAGPNTSLAVLALAVLLAGGYLLWRPGEPPILLLLFAYQWAGASISVFYSNAVGTDIAEFSLWGGQTARAVFLSIVGLFFLSLGMRCGAGKSDPGIGARARLLAASKPVEAWFRLYLIAFGVGFFATLLQSILPSLAQLFIALTSLKWAFFWMLGYGTFVQGKSGRRGYFLAAFCLEFMLGIGGYFSDFKTVILFTLFAMIAARTRLPWRAAISVGLMFALLIAFGVVWTAIKLPYRQFVSGGAASQNVTVSYVAGVRELARLIAGLDRPALVLAGNDLIHRISYVDFFGVVLDNVPASIPHENGALWADAITRPLMPRILFPGKPAIDDTARTNFYTGGILYVADATSVSIGYIGEAYIDFGERLMMLPLFLLGLFYGGIYRWLLTNRRTAGPLGMGLACAVLMIGMALESSITKVFGGICVTLLVVWLVARYIVPRQLPWVLTGVLAGAPPRLPAPPPATPQ